MNRGTVRRTALVLILSFAASGAFAQERPTPPTQNTPNLLVEISRDLANTLAGQSMDQTDPMQEKKGRMKLTGSTHTVSKLNVDFVPAANQAVIDLLLSGTTDANTTAQQGKVSLNLSTGFSFSGSKRIVVDADGIRACPAQSCPKLEYNVLNCIGTEFRGPLDPLVRRIAYKVYTKQQPKIERDATKSAGTTIRTKFDELASQQIAEANRRYCEELRQPLEKRGVFPQKVRILTSQHQLGIRALLFDPLGKTQNFTAVPEIHGWPDIAVRIEESLLNNFTQPAFAGKKFSGEELDKEFNLLLKPVQKEELKTIDPDDKSFSITFPKEKPFEFRFDKGNIVMTLRGEEFMSGDRVFDGMNTTSTYRIVLTKKGFILERVGDLQIFPPGFVPGKDKLGAREQLLRKILEKKFGKVFKAKIEVEDLKLPENVKNGGSLLATQVSADSGWLVLAWRHVPPAAPTVASIPSDR